MVASVEGDGDRTYRYGGHDEVRKLAERTAKSTQEITGMASDISASLHEQSLSSADIARNVETIAQLAEENAAAVAKNAGVAEHLEKIAVMLASEVRPYKIA